MSLRFPESIQYPRRLIETIVADLERYGRYDFRSDGFVRIERWSVRRALESYRQTLASVPQKIEGEPPSATMVTDAIVEWSAEPQDIGYKIRQRHVGTIHPRLRQKVQKWMDLGKPYPSSGGFYHTIPNKSYQRVEELTKYPELRDAVLNLGIQEDWLRFWEIYLPLRYEVSQHLLATVKSGVDVEAFSRHNALAGTGLHIRGRRLKREDLAGAVNDLDFLLPYAYAMGAAFAAVQMAELLPDHVYVVEAYDARIRGAIASRSDMDVLEANFDGERLTIEGIAQTRQAGSDSTGTLANSHTERRMMGSSVTEKVLREFKHDRVEYPFTNRELLAHVWGLDAKPFPNKQYVIGEDFGMMEPIKSPADALFSRGYLKMGNKVMPMMLSGSSWTQAVYGVFHNHFIQKVAPTDVLLALGDDMNLITHETTEDVFAPYIKVKSTDPEQNHKKILGLWTSMSQKDDPLGDQEATIGVVPRVIKTVSSATKRSTAWGENLSDLDEKGTIELVQPEETMHNIDRDLDILEDYIQWTGKRKDLSPMLESKWGRLDPKVFAVLKSYDPDIEHRIQVDEPEEDMD